MKKPKLEDVLKVMAFKKFKVFEKGVYNLNLVGVRSASQQVNVFNDWFCCFYKVAGEWRFHAFQCTTDPGLYWLEHHMELNTRGCAIVKEGRYPGMWSYTPGKKNRHYLSQRSPVTVYRDSDKDKEFDIDPDSVESGLFGINCHSTGKRIWDGPAVVNKYSAGCQVIRSTREYSELIKLVQKQRDSGNGKTCTYTLLNESDWKDAGIGK